MEMELVLAGRILLACACGAAIGLERTKRLKDAGIKIMESGFYETEPPLCGCGAKLDHRDFGPNGKIDRKTYYISVRPEDLDRAKGVLEGV